MFKGSELPSIRALRTFISVANNMSFSRAAQELSVTQGAVSKQISALEQQLGQPLFHRQINGIELSEPGKRYLPKVTQALEIIQHATANLIQSEHLDEVLTVSVTPSFASLWLIPNLSTFNQQHNHIQVRIKTGDGLVKQMDSETEVVVRCLPISTHYDHASLLCKESLLLVASPQFVKQQSIKQLEDLQRAIYIPHVTRPHLWEQFKQELNIGFSLNFYHVAFEHFYLSLEAVKEGKGLAMLPDFMVRNMLERGELVNPLDIALQTNYGYYVHIPSYKLSSRKIYEFNHE